MLRFETLNRSAAIDYMKTECAENGYHYVMNYSHDGTVIEWIVDCEDLDEFHIDEDYYWMLYCEEV